MIRTSAKYGWPVNSSNSTMCDVASKPTYIGASYKYQKALS